MVWQYGGPRLCRNSRRGYDRVGGARYPRAATRGELPGCPPRLAEGAHVLDVGFGQRSLGFEHVQFVELPALECGERDTRRVVLVDAFGPRLKPSAYVTGCRAGPAARVHRAGLR